METLRGPEGARAGGEVTPPHSDWDAAGRGGWGGKGPAFSSAPAAGARWSLTGREAGGGGESSSRGGSRGVGAFLLFKGR